ncbi:hypothetical protein C4Q28_13650 [Pseudomonas sp. SWI6]|uniref:Transporter n=1 Tax=Pseudomonas taiwanensis TaxID=470150 RepID=A0ABR6V613_9PSED|nr:MULTISPECIES: hypothetical protein [Pseudomonas]AVD83135.1 hypothetical protein C4Q28_13650 [Pseudomonas sp. SWI6]AVD90295.1 hypothetical protein C4Q26_25475 [Pseudomonas sp. SWI44]MBC3475866.1 hypothetical protein [Pseudomonas taiwanensis]MBC3489321.1 hypothetical protein [Pseudomonas taiwanensis]MDT8923535.1 hypothetical protein [Pseudomonas taiwanensis]
MRPMLPLFTSLLASISASAMADTFTLASGLDYSSGDYGTGTTSEIWYVPVVAKYETGPMTYKVTVPWLRITNPEVGPDGDPLPGGCRDVESGLGDTVTSAAYALLDGSAGGVLLDLIGKVKFPTADEDQCLGTGEYDYTGQVDIAKAFGPVTGFATLGWKKYGDPPGSDFDDPVFASLGFALPVARGTTAGASYDWRQKVVSTGSQIKELTLFVTHKLSAQWKVQLYAVKGFSDASPDAEGGLMLFHAF